MFATRSLYITLLTSTVAFAAPYLPFRPSSLTLASRDFDNSAIAKVTAFSAADVAGLAPFTQFARAAYCDPNTLQDWKCGEACDALPDFKPTLAGGDGNAIQNFFVGFWPGENTVVVGHQGTDPLELMSVLTDLNALHDDLDSTLFPGVPDTVKVHDGFSDQHAITAPQILAEVKKLLADNKSKTVTLIGHSLGGALAELDCLFLKLNLPADIAIRGRTFGTPRVGNAEFAAFFDSHINDFQRVNNDHDIVPIVPGRFLGFVHPKGEIHLLDDGTAVSCPGNDDSSDGQCQIKSVPNVITGNVLDHLVYNGIHVGSIFCT